MSAERWKKLRHANGPATRVPMYVKRLAGSNAQEREQAFVLLMDAFQHNRQWFSASAPTFLLLLDAAETSTRPDLVLAVAGEILASDSVTLWSESSLQATENADHAATQRAAAENLPRLVSWLGHGRELRAGSALVLAFLGAERERARAEICARLAIEEDAAVRASMWLSVARLGEGDDDALQVVRRGEETEPLARGALALARLRLDPTQSFKNEARGLLDWLSWDVASPHLAAFPWFLTPVALFMEQTGFSIATSQALAALARERNEVSELVDALVVVAEQSEPGPATRRTGDLLIDMGGFGFDPWTVVEPNELSTLERQIAERVAETRILPVAGRGIPGAGKARERWIGRISPGPLDSTVRVDLDGRILSLPRWRAWCALLLRRTLPADDIAEVIVSGLSPTDRWAAVVEFVADTYGVSIALSPEKLDAELERVTMHDAFFVRAAELAGDLAARFLAAQREERLAIPRRELSVLLLEPFVRAGRQIDEAWDPIVFLGVGGETVLRALPPARQLSLIRERVPLGRGSLTELGLSDALPVAHAIAAPPVLEHLDRAIAGLERADPIAGKRYRTRLLEAAKAHAELAEVLEELGRG